MKGRPARGGQSRERLNDSTTNVELTRLLAEAEHDFDALLSGIIDLLEDEHHARLPGATPRIRSLMLRAALRRLPPGVGERVA